MQRNFVQNERNVCIGDDRHSKAASTFQPIASDASKDAIMKPIYRPLMQPKVATDIALKRTAPLGNDSCEIVVQAARVALLVDKKTHTYTTEPKADSRPSIVGIASFSLHIH